MPEAQEPSSGGFCQGTGRGQAGTGRISPWAAAPGPQVQRQAGHGRGAGAISWARLRGHSPAGKHRGCEGTSEEQPDPLRLEPRRPARSWEERRALRKALSDVLCFVFLLLSPSSTW